MHAIDFSDNCLTRKLTASHLHLHKSLPIQEALKNDEGIYPVFGFLYQMVQLILVLIYAAFRVERILAQIEWIIVEWKNFTHQDWIIGICISCLQCGIIVGCYFIALHLETKFRLYLFQKFKRRMVKSHENDQYRPVQQFDFDIAEDFV